MKILKLVNGERIHRLNSSKGCNSDWCEMGDWAYCMVNQSDLCKYDYSVCVGLPQDICNIDTYKT